MCRYFFLQVFGTSGMKVSDLVRSSAFVEQNGIILEIDTNNNAPENETWLLIHWFWIPPDPFRRSLRFPREWVRPREIKLRDIS